MKVLHFIPNDKFTLPYIEFVNDKFNNKSHAFYVIKGENYVKDIVTKDKNIYWFSGGVKNLLTKIVLMNKSEKIILHSLFSKKLLLLLFVQPWLLKKSNWIVWGGDLFSYRESNIIKRIFAMMKKSIVKNIYGISTLVKGDQELVTDLYDTKAKRFMAIYISDERTKQIKEIINRADYFKKKRKKIRVIVGNSATSTNNHLEVFEILKKYKGENIEIVCPLSYGNKEYAEKVIMYGKELFNDKFTYLDSFMTMDDYMEYLSSFDIGIYNNDRQQGLGNIYSMLYLGKKVYMKSGTTMWLEMSRDMSLEVFDIENISHETFDEFAYNDKKIVDWNMGIVRKRYEPLNAISLWTEIFED
ncbi:TDP-N-acetylfucosamine:lipid II N-acetylfucosaminyltransferase [Sutcliffiella deserti]|uniref:TDP-N-acetylfucosamine:lipid II N-acetylfucosaminyltransferase n=1 Tax=Sutcliffiella deserti TaxID=2875501 RepID=UPI001CBF16EE|nr:TDP-N-acetylfucosamine:lipid II N-acetylfucosaminyltransferase [Sutcliffiella deserti]